MEFNRKVTNRLKRIDGQLHGVLRMMDDGQIARTSLHSLVQFVQQLTAQSVSLLREI